MINLPHTMFTIYWQDVRGLVFHGRARAIRLINSLFCGKIQKSTKLKIVGLKFSISICRAGSLYPADELANQRAGWTAIKYNNSLYNILTYLDQWK